MSTSPPSSRDVEKQDNNENDSILRARSTHSVDYGSFDGDMEEMEEIEMDKLRKRDKPKMVFPFKRFGISVPGAIKPLLTFEAIKITIMLAFFFTAFAFLSSQSEPDDSDTHLVGVSATQRFVMNFTISENHVELETRMSLQKLLNPTRKMEDVFFRLQSQCSPAGNDSSEWVEVDSLVVELDHDSELHGKHYFTIPEEIRECPSLRMVVQTNSTRPIAMQLQFILLKGVVRAEITLGLLILVAVYAIIILDLLHRTVAALLGSFLAVGLLSVLHERPSFLTIMTWIDYNTLSLLFGMMVIVGLLRDTGFFEFAAVKAYKIAQGNFWKLLVVLCCFTSVVTAFIDNVTTILLFVPVTISLCKVTDLDPLPIIVAEVIFANIGGTATAIGDPPNVLIVNGFESSGLVNFGSFAIHVAPGIVLIIVVMFFFLKYLYRDKLRRQPNTKRLKEIAIWKLTVEKIRGYEGEEEKQIRRKLEDHVRQLETAALARKPMTVNLGETAQKVDVNELERKYIITDRPLFYKCVAVLAGVISLFFLNSFVDTHLSLAWIALIGTMTLLVLANVKDINVVLEKVELGTLLFFAGLFVLMKSLEELEVMAFIANHTASLIAHVPEGNTRLAAAIIMIIWVGGTVGAFIDNIPFTQTMIPIVLRLTSGDLGLPLTPLVWALAYGCCMGGNATLIGASANVVAAGLAEQQGYNLSFNYFLKTGLPCCMLSLAIATVYLLVTHVLIPWY